MTTLEPAKIEAFQPLPERDGQYSVEFMESRGAVVLREEADRVLVGVVDGTDAALAATIRKFHRKPVEFFGIERMDLAAHLGSRMSEDAPGTGGSGRTDGSERVLLDKLANDAPVVNLVNSICMEAIRSNASDIHIEAGQDDARVRYRVDGVLKTARRIEADRFPRWLPREDHGEPQHPGAPAAPGRQDHRGLREDRIDSGCPSFRRRRRIHRERLPREEIRSPYAGGARLRGGPAAPPPGLFTVPTG
jgi:hypothetical protein